MTLPSLDFLQKSQASSLLKLDDLKDFKTIEQVSEHIGRKSALRKKQSTKKKGFYDEIGEINLPKF